MDRRGSVDLIGSMAGVNGAKVYIGEGLAGKVFRHPATLYGDPNNGPLLTLEPG